MARSRQVGREKGRKHRKKDSYSSQKEKNEGKIKEKGRGGLPGITQILKGEKHGFRKSGAYRRPETERGK